jgi:predicted transcriptional regulator
MTKDSPTEKWSPIFTVRLEPELSERLRAACYNHRLKKQPILRDAVAKLLERESTRSEAAIRKRWSAIVASQPEHTLAMKEALRLSPAQDEALRLFAFKFRLHKQAIVRQSLIEFLDHLDATAAKRKR